MMSMNVINCLQVIHVCNALKVTWKIYSSAISVNLADNCITKKMAGIQHLFNYNVTTAILGYR